MWTMNLQLSVQKINGSNKERMPTIYGNFDFSKPNLKERDIKAIIFKIGCEEITIYLF